MAKLKDKIKTGLDEARMLVLGAQVLIGLQYRAAFEPGFEKLPESSQLIKAVGLALMLVVTALLMSPGAYNRIVTEGEARADVHTFLSRVMMLALLPFALALGIDMYVMTRQLFGFTPGLVFGVAMFAAAIFFWYVLELLRKSSHRHARSEESMGDEDEGGASLKDKVSQVLTEARVVLPGAQALLGFQFISFLMTGFEKLEETAKYVHVASLCLMGLSVVLLMTPAAYHRIVEEGEDTEHFHRTASRLLVAAMIPLALGICGDFFIIVQKVTKSSTTGVVAALLMLALFYGLWFGFTIYRRTSRQRRAASPSHASASRQTSVS